MPASPQYRYTRDEQQLSQLLRAIDGVTTRLAARYALVGGELLQDVVFHPTVAQLRAAAATGALAADLVAAPRQAEVWPAEKLSPTVAWALYELSGRSAPDPSANTYVAWRIKHF